MQHAQMRWAVFLAGFTVLALSAGAKDEKAYVPPPVLHARSYPAHDEHSNERVTIAAAPYDLPPGSKTSVFTTDYAAHGFLPVQLIVSNDGDRPVSLNGLKATLVTANKDKIESADQSDILRRLGGKPQELASPRSPTPIPLPHKKKTSAVDKAQAELEEAQFNALAAEPHSNQSGFLFFDVQGIVHPLDGAHLYVDGLRDADGNPLFYFEIALPPGR